MGNTNRTQDSITDEVRDEKKMEAMEDEMKKKMEVGNFSPPGGSKSRANMFPNIRTSPGWPLVVKNVDLDPIGGPEVLKNPSFQ